MSTLSTTRGWSPSQLAEMSDGVLQPASTSAGAGAATRTDGLVTGVSIDTRTLQPGDLFVPLPGSRTDGHTFLARAFARGAAASFCSVEHYAGVAGHEPGPLIVVADVTAALQRLAQRHRRGWSGTLLAITGSNGKTTTKELVAAVFATAKKTLKTEGNLNNHWGLPLTLLQLAPEHEVAVVEMGMNRPGEIAMLAGLARPTAGLITNVGTAHIERFGSIASLAREKASLGFALEADHWLFASADSPALLAALEGAPARLVTFGLNANADLTPRRIEDLGPRGTRIEVPGFPPFRLPLIGRHQVSNALAALAVALAYGLDPRAVAAALENESALPGRMEIARVRDATLLLDFYNANPDSTRAALEALATWPGATRRIALLGDMLELGDQAAALHREVGASVRNAELWVTGAFAGDYAAGARDVPVEVRTFADVAAMRSALRAILAPGLVVLIKASRGVQLERVLEGLEPEG